MTTDRGPESNGEDQVDAMSDQLGTIEMDTERPNFDNVDRTMSPELEEAVSAAGDNGDPEAAIKAWKEVWTIAPGHPEIVDALVRLFAQTEKWHGLADFFKKQSGAVSNESHRIYTQMTLANIYDDHLKQDVMVVNTYQAIVKQNPDYLPAINAAAAKYEAMSRWPDLVKMLKAKGAAVTRPEEKVDVFMRVAQLFLQRFSNQAEAIKAFEQVLAADPLNQAAIEYLKEMYEKRRDWEKLSGVMRAEAEQLEGEERVERFIEIAKLTTERLKRPAVCIETWEAVLELVPDNSEALVNLATFYERAKEWEKLTNVLEKQLGEISDPAEQTPMLQKLGQIYGDKIGNDEKAVEAWKAITEINPGDRRAQEQLKKRYIAIRAWDKLEEFYAATGKWDEFIRVLERETDREDVEKATKVELQFKIAELWNTKKSRADRAAGCYQKILEIDPNNFDAAEAIIPLLEEKKDSAKLADVLEVRLNNLEDAQEKLALRQRIARIAEEELKDADRAFTGFLDAFKMAPSSEFTQDDLERVAGTVERWEDVVEVYNEVLDGEEGNVALRLRVARVHDEELKQPEEALKFYNEILSSDPKNPQAVTALEKIFAQMGRYEELLDIYARRLEMAEDEDERVEILHNQALLWEEEVGDSEKAIEVLLKITEMVGDDPRVLRGLDRLYSHEQRWSELADVLNRALEQGVEDFDESIDLKFRLGKVYCDELNQKSKALDCYREILTEKPEHEGTLAALETLLDDEGQQDEAAKILAPFYEEQEQWDKLFDVIEILVTHSDDNYEKYEHLLKKGEISSQNLGSPERAFVSYSRAFRINPNDIRALVQLEEVTAILDSWGDLVELLEEGAEVAEDHEVSKSLWLNSAKIYDSQLENMDKAIFAYANALRLDSRNAEAIEALEQIYSRTERWDELVDVYRAKVQLVDDVVEKEEIYLQMAMIYEQMLDRPEDAVKCLEEILTFDSSNLRALRELDKLLRSLERWPDLADNLLLQLSAGGEPDEIIDLKLRLADLRGAKLEQMSAAIETYREVLEIDEANDQAIGALENIIELDDYKREVADILEPIYKNAGENDKLTGVYEILIEQSEYAARKVDLLHEIAQMAETSGDEPEKAFRTLARALEIEPSDENTQAEMERLADVMVLFDELATVYAKIVETIDNYDLAASYHFKIAKLYEEQVQDMENAIKHYRLVLDVDPMHLEAATALERTYQIVENYEDLAIVYLKKVEMVTDPAEQKALLFKAAQIYEDIFERPEKAVESYMRILEIDEDDLEAIGHLEALYLMQERWTDLQEIYNRKVDLVATSEEKREVLYILGAMYEREVNDERKAIQTYQRILEFDSDDIQAVQRLDVLFTEAEEWHDLLHILEHESEMAEDPDEAISFQFRIGELYVKHLDDIPRAVDYFREILVISPDHEPTIRALEELIADGQEPMLVADVLEPLYQQLADWRKLVGVVEVKLGATDDPWQRLEMFHKMAELLESEIHLDSPSEAFDVYARSLKEDRLNEKTLERLDTLAEQTGRFVDLADLYDEQLADIVESEQAVELGLRAAGVYEHKLDKQGDAIERYQKVLEFDGENKSALMQLDSLFQEQERWEELASVLQQRSVIVDDPDESLELQFRLGQVYQTELDDLEKSIDVYRDILAAEPAHEATAGALEFLFADGVKRPEIGEILEPIYRMQAEWNRLASLYEAQLQDLEDPGDKISMMHRIAEIQEDKNLDAVEAFNWYCQAFSHDPFDERSGIEVERLADSVDGWSDLADLYQNLYSTSEEEDVKRFCAKRLAKVAQNELGDVARAEQAYRACLELGGDDLDVLSALDGIYTEYMEWERLVGILNMLADVVPTDDKRIEHTHRMGTIYETQLDDFTKAKECFHRIVDELAPGHRQSLDHLELIYADQEDWPALFEIYSRMKDAADSESSEADLFAKLATISAECLDDVPRAIEYWGNVLDILGEDANALEAMADLYSKQENWRDLVDVLERAVIVVEEDEDRIRLYSQLGLVWGECLGRDRNSLENWENVLSIDSGNLGALRAIAAINESNQDWEMLIETIDRIIAVGATELEADELRGYYAKLGSIYGDTLDQPMEAIDSWQNGLDVDPTHLETVEALEKLYAEQEMWNELIDILGRKADLLSGDDQIETLLAQARVHEDQLEMPLDAKPCYARIIELSPLHEHAFDRMVEIQTEEETWLELTEFYFDKLNYLEDTGKRIKIYNAGSKIYEEKLSQPENAFLVMQRAFEEDYSSDVTADYLERLASVTGKWDELLDSCTQVLQSVEDQETQINLYLKMGKWYASKLNNGEFAIQCYQAVLGLSPENVQAYKLMGDLYRSYQQWDELIDALKHAIECEKEDEARKNLLVELGQVYEEYVHDVPLARKAYKHAIELDPGMETAITALERLLGAAMNWEELVPILRRKLEVISEDVERVVSTHLRIGEIYETHLDESQTAIEEYRKVLDFDGTHLKALKGLERLYEKLERWQDLLDILEIQYENASSERERISLLTRIAKMLEEEFVKPDKAAENYQQVIDIDPNHLETYVALENIYRKTGNWEEFIRTTERHIDAIPDRNDRIEYHRQMGEVYASELDSVDDAIDAYQQILDIDPEHEDALNSLAKLQTKQEDWVSAHETLNRLADTVADPEQKIDLYYRLGKLNEDHLFNRQVAMEHFRSALDVEPGHLPALAALKAIHVDEAEWVDAARIMEEEQEYTENARNQSKIRFELAELYQDKLEEPELANTWYERALEADSDNQKAAEPLVDVYLDDSRWDEASALLDMLVRLGGKRPASEMQPIHLKYALVADKLDDLEKSLKGYQAAYTLDSSHLPTVLGMGDVHYRLEHWDKAFKFYQMILVHHRDSQNKNEIVEIFHRLGRIKAELKERRKALNMFDKALEINRAHLSTLEQVVALHAEQKNFEQVIHYKKEMMEAVDDAGKLRLLVEIGDLWKENLKNPQKAISSYVEATELDPSDRPTLHKLLPLYQETKQWKRVVEVIQLVTDMETDEVKLARMFYSMGAIYRDELKTAEQAVDCFNKALDASLENLKAFEAIDKILTQAKDWKSLERNYRKMLHRISGTGRTELEINLWHFLGEIYRTRMQQYEPAAEAFKMATALDPDNAMRHEILAELFASLPDRVDEAVAEHQWLIHKNPYRVESYKALRKIYFDSRQYDKAWCLCSTLVFLKKADAEEQQFFEQYRTRGMIRAQARLDNERWIKDLFHADESVYVGKIFESITRTVRSLKIQPIKVYGLKKNQKRPANDTMTFSKTFFYAAQVLNLPQVPDLYIQDDKPGGLSFAITEPMASVSGASLLSGYSPQDLLFLLGRHLTYCRPEHYVRWVLPSHGELKLLLLAAIKIGAPEFKLPTDKTGVLAQYVDVLNKQMNPMEAEAVVKVVRHFVQSGAVTDIKKWINAVELTACRAGFLLANDLEVAARMIQSEAGSVDEMPAKEKIKELVLFSVSESYFSLRDSLGIKIGE